MREQVKQEMLVALEAAESKKAENLVILEMDQTTGAFTDHFIICSGSNPRQMQSVADEIELQVKRQTGTYAHQVEGYREAEWILVDYVDFVVHIFSEERRAFYGLERLWRSAKVISVADFKSARADEELSPEQDIETHIAPTKRTAKKGRAVKALSTRTVAKGSSTRSGKSTGVKRASSKAAAKKKGAAKRSTKRK
ncbi:MAG: hypothetical protein NVS9B15_19730 [Acidobacteriaceae bacterium]